MNDKSPLPLVSVADCNPVPVFNCQIILTQPDEHGRRHGRVANLAEISAAGNSERDVLTALMKQFKAVVQQLHQNQKPIPWIDPPEKPGPGEVERFIPVHL
jgi:predicted RNase H-like HicB family nuclease